MSGILFIGYGNPLRGDDGFGWHLAQRLQQRFQHCDIEIRAVHQLTPELAEPISRAGYVIFADAAVGRHAAGLTLRKLQPGAMTVTSYTHQLCPKTLTGMARALYGSSPHAAFLLSAQAYEMGYREALSPGMEQELDRAVERIVGLCEFLSPHFPSGHIQLISKMEIQSEFCLKQAQD